MATNKTRLTELERAAQAQGKKQVIVVWEGEDLITIKGHGTITLQEARRRYPEESNLWIYVEYVDEVTHETQQPNPA